MIKKYILRPSIFVSICPMIIMKNMGKDMCFPLGTVYNNKEWEM